MLRFCFIKKKRHTLLPFALRWFSVESSVSPGGNKYSRIEKLDSEPSSRIVTRQKKELKAFNRTAVLDLLHEKFDDDLLYFPEILSKEEWCALVERGHEVEQLVQKINYNEVLTSGKLSRKVLEELREIKLFQTHVPCEYGGLDSTMTENTYIHEILGQTPSIARIISENEEMGIRVVTMFGNEEQKRRLLPKLATGEKLISFALLEDSSNLLDVNSYVGTHAYPVNGNFKVTGKKCWVYNGSHADYFIVFATHTVSDAEGAFLVHSLFLVDAKHDGVTVHEPMEKKWFRGLDVCDVTFTDVVVKQENIIGGFGKGLPALKKLLQLNKSHICAECASSMKRLLHDCIQKCTGAEFMEKPLIDFPYVQAAVAELAHLTYAVESLTYYVAARGDYFLEPDLTLEVMLAKIFASETLPEALQLYFSVIGKTNYEKGSFVEELVQNTHYYSVLDDNTSNMKLFLMTEALQYVSGHIYPRIVRFLQPGDYPLDKLKGLIQMMRRNLDKLNPMLNLSSSVHPDLSYAAENLESCIYLLIICVEYHFKTYGSQSLSLNYELMKLADMLINIYALMATLARASRAACLQLPKYKDDIRTAKMFSIRTKSLVTSISRFYGSHFEEITGLKILGKRIFTEKNYFPNHPLLRNF